MKALSIKQPWAWAIIHGGKTIENRNWNTKHRGFFWVHASKGFDINAPNDLCEKYLAAKKGTNEGGIIGCVKLVDVVTESDNFWFQGKFGFVLEDPKPIEFVPYKGQLNFFNVEVKP